MATAFMIVCTAGALLIPHGRLPRRAPAEAEAEPVLALVDS